MEPFNPQSDFRLHHVGLITSNLEESIILYEQLGYSSSVVFLDPIQKARIVLMQKFHEPMMELVSPDDKESPAAEWVQRIKAGPYHLCYEVNDLDFAISFLRKQRMMIVLGPVAAVAFEMRHVAFLWSNKSGLIEVLQS